MFKYLLFIDGNQVVKIYGQNWSYVLLFLTEEEAILYGNENYPNQFTVYPVVVEGNILDGYDRDTLN